MKDIHMGAVYEDGIVIEPTPEKDAEAMEQQSEGRR